MDNSLTYGQLIDGAIDENKAFSDYLQAAYFIAEPRFGKTDCLMAAIGANGNTVQVLLQEFKRLEQRLSQLEAILKGK